MVPWEQSPLAPVEEMVQQDGTPGLVRAVPEEMAEPEDLVLIPWEIHRMEMVALLPVAEVADHALLLHLRVQ
jgi:hypothetical protein